MTSSDALPHLLISKDVALRKSPPTIVLGMSEIWLRIRAREITSLEIKTKKRHPEKFLFLLFSRLFLLSLSLSLPLSPSLSLRGCTVWYACSGTTPSPSRSACTEGARKREREEEEEEEEEEEDRKKTYEESARK